MKRTGSLWPSCAMGVAIVQCAPVEKRVALGDFALERRRPDPCSRSKAMRAAGPPQRPGLRIEITTTTIVRGVVVVAGLWLLVQLWPIVLLVVVALMLAGALAPPVNWLEHHGVKRKWAIAVLFTALAAAVAGFLLLAVPSFVAELSDIIERFPRLQQQVAALLDQWRPTERLAQSVRSAQVTDLLTKAADVGLSYSTRVAEVIAYGVTCIFLALYLMVDRDRMRGALFSLVPRTFHVRLSRVFVGLGTIVGGYVRGQVITSIMMAVFTFAVLEIARVPNALALSVFAGATDVLPYVGALLACGPAVVGAYAAHGFGAAVPVLIALAVYQEIESRAIVPRVYGRVLRLPSAVVVVSLLIGGMLLGVLGALLALPMAAAIRMIVEELRVKLPGEPRLDSATRLLDAREEQEFRDLVGDAPAEESAVIAAEIVGSRIEDESGH